eukprot:TRINITY_DN73107_c0_g1_i1.p1 TRINITY_DN73107_c0_g1~~TRINITY_DN73107_c0_g1_i1.p1  ORF type:complete len:348 (+),score=46.24 TRINITY_DN73107_c0_g1_i1:69-1112(+)
MAEAAVGNGGSGDEEANLAWTLARSVFSLAVPVFPGEKQAFGPRPLAEVAVNLCAATAACATAGYILTRRSPVLLRLAQRITPELRDEAWEDLYPPADINTQVSCSSSSAASSSGASKAHEEDSETGMRPRRQMHKRTGLELLFIGVHNSAVAALASLAWLLGLPSLALFAFCLEVAYEIFDTWSLGRMRMEPETLIHHIVSPICILCSTQTDVDYRVLCHLCICIDLSGAVLGYCKFLLRFSHWSSVQIYRNLVWVYFALRVVLPFTDTAIIVRNSIQARGGFFGAIYYVEEDGRPALFAKSDSTQLYFWAMAVLDAFNLYFFLVIRARARMSPQQVQYLERTGCH